MKKPPAFDPFTGNPPVRFGGRGRPKPIPTPISCRCFAQNLQLVKVPDADCRCRAIRPGNQLFVIQLLVRVSSADFRWMPNECLLNFLEFAECYC